MYRLPEPTCNILPAVIVTQIVTHVIEQRDKIRIPTEIELGER